LILPFAVVLGTNPRDLGSLSLRTLIVFGATIAIPLAVVVVIVLAVAARRFGASRLLTGYAFAIALAMAGLSAYLGAHGLVGLRLWSY
jgi:hypothetical protein